MRVFFTVLLAAFITMNSAFAAQYKGNAKTARIPAGTKLPLQLLQTVDTASYKDGDSFNLMLTEDEKADGNVVLPAGSVIRACVRQIKPSKRLSRGAVLYLDFDHVVTPAGRQLPIGLNVFGIKKLTYDGGIYQARGYGQALKENQVKMCDITKCSINYGKRAKNAAAGLQFITIPVCAIGGAIGGAGYFIGDSVADLFKKGAEVILPKGSTLEVIMSQPLDLPVS